MILNNQSCEGFRNYPKPYGLFFILAKYIYRKMF